MHPVHNRKPQQRFLQEHNPVQQMQEKTEEIQLLFQKLHSQALAFTEVKKQKTQRIQQTQQAFQKQILEEYAITETENSSQIQTAQRLQEKALSLSVLITQEIESRQTRLEQLTQSLQNKMDSFFTEKKTALDSLEKTVQHLKTSEMEEPLQTIKSIEILLQTFDLEINDLQKNIVIKKQNYEDITKELRTLLLQHLLTRADQDFW